MTSTLPPLHAEFIERVRAAVALDERFTALLAGGSYIHGGFDQHSDLDFVLVVDEADYADVMASRMQFAESIGGLLTAFTGEHVGEPRLLICLYGPTLLHVDLKFVTSSDLDRRIELPAVLYARDGAALESRLASAEIAWPDMSPEWFEQRAWVWLHYGAAKFARGELFEAMGILSFFREQVLGPMLHRRAGRPQRGVRRVEQLGLDHDGRLSATVPLHDPSSVHASILASINLYIDLRNDALPRKITPTMPEALIDFFDRNCKSVQ